MKKSAHYRRAVWLDPNGQFLAQTLADCIDQIADGVIHSFDLSRGLSCLVARRVIDGGRVLLHFVVFEQGAQAAIMPVVRQAEELDADVADPPVGNEYIQSQLFVLFQQNDLVWTTHNAVMREGAIYDLIRRFVESLSNNEDLVAFGLQAVLDRAALQRMFDEGIQEIDLGIGGFDATIERLVNGDAIPGGGILASLGSLVSNVPTPEERAAAADLTARVLLRPGRAWSRPDMKNLLTTMAENVYGDHDEQFVIVTKSGLRLTREKMTVHRPFNVVGDKQAIATLQVIQSLYDFLDYLMETGALEN